MVGVALSLLLCIGAVGVGFGLLGRWTRELDPAARIGIHGVAGLGSLGTLSLFLGLLPGGFQWGIGIVGAFALAGYWLLYQDLRSHPITAKMPDGLEALFPFAYALAGGTALVSVLVPSDMMDWDSLAYHLAVPKLYLQAGHIYPVFIHQSNFPSAVDLLYVWGLSWGGEHGAKAFSFGFFILALLAVFGFARQRYGRLPGWWAGLAFVWAPVVLWEAGTGYIDLANGAFAGLGILFLASYLSPKEGEERQSDFIWLAGVMLGFAAGSKYTGLQTIFACALALVMFQRSASGVRAAFTMGLIASLIACPWYVKTAVYTGNPVFPFFYERFGGRNWDQRRADIYRNQQQIFGVGRTERGHDPLAIGAAVLGLDYQPGRYVDPDPVDDYGSPLGAIGSAAILGALWWCASGRSRRFEQSVLAVAGISLLMWFFLSQQSRYMVPLLVPMAVLLGGGVRLLRAGQILAAVAVLQVVYSLYLFKELRLTSQMPTLRGTISEDDYRSLSVPFFAAAQEINRDAQGGKVALYDEVFGFYLDVPYMWANPGHSTLIPYDQMTDGSSYVKGMSKLGFTHIYVNLRQMYGSRDDIDRWLTVAGLEPASPAAESGRLDAWERPQYDNWETKYKILLADAISKSLVVPVKQFNNGILLKIVEPPQ